MFLRVDFHGLPNQPGSSCSALTGSAKWKRGTLSRLDLDSRLSAGYSGSCSRVNNSGWGSLGIMYAGIMGTG